MAMDQVQFQTGMSLLTFLKRNGSDAQCEQALQPARWPDGFVRPLRQATAGTQFMRSRHKYWREVACQLGGVVQLIQSNGCAVIEQPSACWVNAVLSNLKRRPGGAIHAFNLCQYASRYLGKARWCFNRRFDLAARISRALIAARLLLLQISLFSLSFSLAPSGFAQAEQGDVPALLALEQPVPKASIGRNANPYLKRLVNDPAAEEITLARGYGKFLLDEQKWLDIPLEQGVTARVKKMHFSEQSNLRIWTGEVQSSHPRQRNADLSREAAIDPQNIAILVNHHNKITGTVIKNGRRYEIEPVGGNQVAITRMAISGTADTVDDSPPKSEIEVSASTEKRAGNQTIQRAIRVLTVYSNDVKNSHADPVALGTLRFEYFKQTAIASGVSGTHENAGVVHLNYDQPEKNCLGSLDCMRRQLSPVAPQSENIRHQLKAQVVIAILDTDGGLASTSGPSSLSQSHAYAGMGSPMTYAHEVGHLIGADHDDAGRPFPYSRAYCQGDAEPYWRTIMGYCTGLSATRIGFYSTPLLNHSGRPLGSADRDNVRSINNWFQTVVGFFPDPDPAAAPIASGFVELGQKEMPFSSESVKLNGSASRNPGIDAMRYEWTQTAGVPAATIDQSQSVVATAHFSEVQAPTDYRFRLTVSNASGHVDTTEVAVRVYPRDHGSSCEGIPAWIPSQVYSVPGQKVAYQGQIYQLITAAAGTHVQRHPVVWSGLAAPMNWSLLKACDAPRSLQQRLAAVDAWASVNRNSPVTTGLQQQLHNLLIQQQLTWPQRQAAGRLRPIDFESKNCVVKNETSPDRLPLRRTCFESKNCLAKYAIDPNSLILREACDEAVASSWLLDASGRLHNMEYPGLCVRTHGSNQAVTMEPCADSSTAWVRLKESVVDYRIGPGQALLSNPQINATQSYGDYLADDGNRQLTAKTKTPAGSIKYLTFGNVPQDSSLLLAHANAETLAVVGLVMDSEGRPGAAPPMPPMVIITGPVHVRANEQVTLDATGSSSINPGAGALTYDWKIPEGLPAQPSGATLRFTAPAATSATRYVFTLVVDDGQAQGEESHTVTVSSDGYVGPEGELSAPAEMLEKKTAIFTADVRSPGGLPLTYTWERPPGFTGTIGNTASITLTAPPVAADTELPIAVQIKDGEDGTLKLEEFVLVKKNTQMTGGKITGKSTVDSEEEFTQRVEISNPENRPLTYSWVVTSPPAGELKVIGSSTEQEITLKAPRITSIGYHAGAVRANVSDGVTNVSIPNKTIIINEFVLPPLTGRLMVPTIISVGEVVEPYVVLDNPEGRDITYRWFANPSFFEFIGSSDEAVPKIKAIKSTFNNSTVLIEATVSDGTGSAFPFGRQVSVHEPQGDHPPEGQVSGPQEVSGGQASITYRADFTSPVNNPLNYEWMKGVLIGPATNSAQQTWAAPIVDSDQVVTVGVTVSDDAGNSIKKSIPVLIKAQGGPTPKASVPGE